MVWLKLITQVLCEKLERKSVMADNRIKLDIGDLMISHPLRDTVGVVVEVEEDFYKTNYGPQARYIIYNMKTEQMESYPLSAIELDWMPPQAHWSKVDS